MWPKSLAIYLYLSNFLINVLTLEIVHFFGQWANDILTFILKMPRIHLTQPPRLVPLSSQTPWATRNLGGFFMPSFREVVFE